VLDALNIRDVNPVAVLTSTGMAKKTSNELTVREVAERTGAAISTVTLYCRDGRFPNAHQVETPRGPVWYVPESDLNGVEVRSPGRPATKKGSKK
jgi:predicted DNA-binding transcriptional regulator AlpA